MFHIKRLASSSLLIGPCILAVAACAAPGESATRADLRPDERLQIVLCAHHGKITPPFEVAENPGSLHGRCIDVPKGAGHGKEGSSGPVVDTGWVDFSFEVAARGEFDVYGRVFFTGSDGNSFFMVFDGGDPHILADDTWNRWHWVRLAETTALDAGSHTLRVRNREDGVKLDEIRLLPAGGDAFALLPKTWMERLAVLCPRKAREALDAYFHTMTPVRPPAYDGTAESWTARRAEVRKRVLQDIGLDPMPENVPLDPRIVATLKRDGYAVHRLYFQLFPGCYGSGWLYVPDPIEGTAPAVLNPHGHWTNRAYEDTAQMRMIGLAKKGYIALMTDNIHAGDLETGMTPIGLMTWQNLRALDYLLSRDDVDPARIGVTGASGGGQQTMYLMGLDDRLKAAVPVVMASYFERILTPDNWHCWCNHAPGIARDTDTIEILCCFAPRPALFICSAKDWTANFPEEEFEEVKKVWSLYGAVDQVECRISDAPHGYERERREAMYRFMNAHLGMEDPDNGREPEITPESMETLREMDVPMDGLWDWAKATAWYRAHHQPSATANDIPDRLAELIRSVPPAPETVGGTLKGHLEFDGGALDLLLVKTEAGLELPALFLLSPSAERRAPAVVLLQPEGKSAVFDEEKKPSPLARTLLDGGIHVLALDARLTGELKRNWERNCLIWGRPEAGMAADDACWAARYLAGREEVDPDRIFVVGLGGLGVSALLAALIGDEFSACVFDGMERCYGENPLHDREGYYSGDRWLWELGLSVIPHILDVADLPGMALACKVPVAVLNSGDVRYEGIDPLDAGDHSGLTTFLLGR